MSNIDRLRLSPSLNSSSCLLTIVPLSFSLLFLLQNSRGGNHWSKQGKRERTRVILNVVRSSRSSFFSLCICSNVFLLGRSRSWSWKGHHFAIKWTTIELSIPWDFVCIPMRGLARTVQKKYLFLMFCACFIFSVWWIGRIDS